MAFRYSAVDARGKTLVDTINAASTREAVDHLRERGLFVTRLEQVEDEAPVETFSPDQGARARTRLGDIVFFTQQMAMLMRSGARVVQALEAVEEQIQRPAWRRVIHAVRVEVEEGRPLSAALEAFPRIFPPLYTNLIAAGEASGDLGMAFTRLSRLMTQQQQIRNRVIGALTYPAALLLLCVGVMAALFLFVMPRFADMFEALEVDLPITTTVMMAVAALMLDYWIVVLLLPVAAAGGGFAFVRSEIGRRFLSRAALRIPVFGPLIRNIIFARLCRTWGQLLESKVSLIDAVDLADRSTTSLDFKELMVRVNEAITEGNSVGPVIKASWLVPKTFAAAIITGEQSGKLGDALLFVGDCLDDENTQVLNSLTKLIEPMILVVMGLVVGTVAVSLFLPMFDTTAAAGG